MVFKGTMIVEGSAQGIVVATGMDTELGKIAEMAEQAEGEATPLEERLDRLAGRLAWLALGSAGIISILGLLSGRPPINMVETAVALGVAAIPEGLPIVSTIALARGMWIMARRQVLVKKLNAVETLGATGTIFTDKTGTLTENRMEVKRLVTPRDEIELTLEEPEKRKNEAHENDRSLVRRLIEVGVLCNNAHLTDEEESSTSTDARGDPTEIALLRVGALLGLRRTELIEDKPEQREESFSPETMMMATFHRTSSGLEVAVKGAPEKVLEACNQIATDDGEGQRDLEEADRDAWIDRAEALASEGLRLLALADKQIESVETEPYTDLRFLGFACLVDPIRSDVKHSIAACQKAGIRVIMVTGDKPETARAIGEVLGLAPKDDASVMLGRDLSHPDRMSEKERNRVLDTDIFARVQPQHKLELIRIFQDRGEVVGMTGDGVNDTPALKKADIGIAMGRKGTEAARQVADMVLKDDALSSIVAAVEQGRIIFDNIRKSLLFMLCTNVAEVIAVGLAAVVDAPLPLKPLQILYLNVITDVFPALALSVGPGGRKVMSRPPRDESEPMLTRTHWRSIIAWGFGMAACVLVGLGLADRWLGLSQTEAVTLSFLILAFGKLWFVFNLREPGSGWIDNEVVRNRWIWGSFALCVLLLLGAVYLPQVAFVLDTQAPDAAGWSLVLVMSLLPFLAGQTILAFQTKEN
jgi:Ca2+-transporting ATPase